MSVAARVAQLVALAGSPYEQEARTSAYLACKLIREHGLRVTDGEAPEAYEADTGVRERGEHRVDAPPYVDGGACRATARYAVVCMACKRLIGEGAGLWWMRGVGGVHIGCNPSVLYPGHGRTW